MALLGSAERANPSARDAETFLHPPRAKPCRLPRAASQIHGNWECVAPGKTELAVKTLFGKEGNCTAGPGAVKLAVGLAGTSQNQDHGVEQLIKQSGECAALSIYRLEFHSYTLITWLALPWFYNKILGRVSGKSILPGERRRFPTSGAEKHQCYCTTLLGNGQRFPATAEPEPKLGIDLKSTARELNLVEPSHQIQAENGKREIFPLPLV